MMTRLVAPAPAPESLRMMNPPIPTLSPVPTALRAEILTKAAAVVPVGAGGVLLVPAKDVVFRSLACIGVGMLASASANAATTSIILKCELRVEFMFILVR